MIESEPRDRRTAYVSPRMAGSIRIPSRAIGTLGLDSDDSLRISERRLGGRVTARIGHDIRDPALVADWQAIASEGLGTVFQSLPWATGLVDHFAKAEHWTPVFVTLRCAWSGQPLAIFPLASRRHLGLTVVEYIGGSLCDMQSPIVANWATLTPDLMNEVATALQEALRPADVLILSRMPGTIAGRPNPMLQLPGIRQSRECTWPITLEQTSDATVATTSAYKIYQKQWRKLARREGIEYRIFEASDEIASAFDHMVAMRHERFAALQRDDLLTSDKVTAFYRDMALLPEAQRNVRIAGLKVGARWVAYIYMLVGGGRFSTIISAIDNSAGNAYAPALILFTKLFEHAMSTGFAAGDIGIGHMHYKTRFSRGPSILHVWERPLSLRGRLALECRALARHAMHLARRLPILRNALP